MLESSKHFGGSEREAACDAKSGKGGGSKGHNSGEACKGGVNFPAEGAISKTSRAERRAAGMSVIA